jgi:hypothetical protein
MNKKILLVFGILALIALISFFSLPFLVSSPIGKPHLVSRTVVSLRSSYSNRFTVISSPEFVFSEGEKLTSTMLSESLPEFASEKICLFPGEFENYFSSDYGSQLIYTYKSFHSFKIASYCVSESQNLSADLYSEIQKDWVNEQVSKCECVSNPDFAEEVCCVLFPVTA